jgi:uncharacterized protein YajQ (UPF0234 family)
MPSIDVVSRINFAELDNAVNNTLKAVAARFDFRNSPVEIAVDRKEKKIKMSAAEDGKMKALQEMFTQAAIKRGLDMKAFDFQDIEAARHAALGNVKREIKLREGLESDVAKQIVKIVKDSKIKVQASIQGDEVRLSGKSIDDIRTVMKMLDGAGLPQPLQYVNPKS